MAKKSQIDNAIEQLDDEIAVLMQVKARLIAWKQTKPKAKRGPRAVPGTKEAAS